ncbi:hypothetical protein PVAND_005524 [Polypedilum vanderplanki]|uniref:Uncharacterized protein n=1 Tax=Polypedilum vanderplanki TaxID=319348 RepID=A0A9J6C0F9_POLVA|nr:hypothetical protein PVAND_005524 [Polypedilum vanderplanki]
MHEEAIAAAASSSSSKLTTNTDINIANANNTTPHQSNATIDHHFNQIENFDAADMPNQIVTSQTKIIITNSATAELKSCSGSSSGEISSIIINPNDSNTLYINTTTASCDDSKNITNFIQLTQSDQKEIELNEILTDNEKASEDGELIMK